MNHEQSERNTREVAAKLESEIRRLQRSHEMDVSRHQSQMEAKESEMNVLTQKLGAKDQELEVGPPLSWTAFGILLHWLPSDSTRLGSTHFACLRKSSIPIFKMSKIFKRSSSSSDSCARR